MARYGIIFNIDGINADGAKSMFILTILEKNQRNKIKIFSRKCNSIKEDDIIKRRQLN